MRDKNLGDCMGVLKINTEDEDEAIQTLRNLIANLSTLYLEVIKRDVDLLQAYSEIFGDGIDTSLSNIKTDTIEEIQTKIRTNKKWATTLEFHIMEELLKSLCGLTLKNIYNENSILDDDNLDRKDIIYLFNKNNVHFTYFHKED